MENPILIFGAGNLGKIALDIFNRNNVVVYGFLDDNKELHNQEIGDIIVLGDTDDDGFLKLIGQKTEAFVALENNKERKKLIEMLNNRRKVMPVNAVHNTAVVSAEAFIGHGNLVAARAVVNPYATVGNHCILHASAVVDINAVVGDYVQIGAGAIINSEATVEEGAFIGSGAVIISGITIGKNARVGAGSVVIENVAEGTTVFGNPAKKI
ncbi:Putative acetyltransferase EpsM [Emticicia aquatica]|uniref:Acetyltransferase EpsM n=1 Tax=Emticicia aquatica TaxID=1681835 RepID=A0ABM9ARX8_9BACT|nr:acetyltransferase [Emticicia aquatica]CAH0996634.1 Putative acetyltransferase EpsM [Emticicia aquatica]